MNVYLDDIRIPKMSNSVGRGLGEFYSDSSKWIIIRDYFEFINFIKTNFDEIDLISFDHDLACYENDLEYTGKDAANFIIDYCLDNDKKFPSWFVHSDNTSGKKNIKDLIINYLDKVENVNISNIRYYHNGFINGVAV